MRSTPQLDKLLAGAQATDAKQPNQDAIEHVMTAMLRRAKTDPKLATELVRISPKGSNTN